MVNGEPRTDGPAEIPDSVLDELRSAFAGEAGAAPERAAAPDRPAPSAAGAPRRVLGDDLPDVDLGAGTHGADDRQDGGRGRAADGLPPRVVEPPPSDLVEPWRTRAPGDLTSTSPRSKKDAAKASKRAAREERKQIRAAVKDARKAAKGGEPVPVPGTGPGAGGPATIVIGGDDDLPDALYLDDDAEVRLREVHASAGGPIADTIVIGDDLDSSGVFDAVEPRTGSMDPRVRARRIAVKRAAGRRRLIWVAIVGGVVLLVTAALAVLASSLFGVEQVRITGAVYTDAAALQAIVDDVDGDAILLLDTTALEERIEALAWVERAVVTTDFPHRVDIDIRERLPLATFAGSDGSYRVIDRDGRVLAVLDNQPVDYLLITGAAPDTDVAGYSGTPFAHAAQLAQALPPEIRTITTSVSVDATSGDLGLVLQPEVEVRLGGFDDLDDKLARLLQFMRNTEDLSVYSRLDVSTGEVSKTSR